jgi:hypothetical protein
MAPYIALVPESPSEVIFEFQRMHIWDIADNSTYAYVVERILHAGSLKQVGDIIKSNGNAAMLKRWVEAVATLHGTGSIVGRPSNATPSDDLAAPGDVETFCETSSLRSFIPANKTSL